jgi:hypothetical protein
MDSVGLVEGRFLGVNLETIMKVFYMALKHAVKLSFYQAMQTDNPNFIKQIT